MKTSSHKAALLLDDSHPVTVAAKSVLLGSGYSRLSLVMQPILSVKNPTGCLNFETLLRYSGDAAVIPTEHLVTAAEHLGCAGELDLWVVVSLTAWMRANRAVLASKTRFVCVNLSAASLSNPAILGPLYEVLRQDRWVTEKLCLEITESKNIDNMALVADFVRKAQSLGAKVAIDDFGAGHTTFDYLRNLPVNVLKIDGALVRQINNHPNNASIVEAMAGLARNMGMQTIAEWAEDADTVATLAELGVDHIQGWAVSRPVRPDVLLRAAASSDFIRDARVQAVLGLHTSVFPRPGSFRVPAQVQPAAVSALH